MNNKQHNRQPTLHEQILAKRAARGYTKRSLPTSTHNTALPNILMIQVNEWYARSTVNGKICLNVHTALVITLNTQPT